MKPVYTEIVFTNINICMYIFQKHVYIFTLLIFKQYVNILEFMSNTFLQKFTQAE
jgi:hypothetical protein